MTTRISLIAARNGLGHCRRLLNLSYALIELGFEIDFFATSRQMKLLSVDLEKIRLNPNRVKFLCIGDYGIDTMNMKFFTIEEPTPSHEVASALARSSAVISDNSTWASNYHENFYLLGHFDWFSIWLSLFARNSPKHLIRMLREIEALALSRVRVWFQTVDFTLNQTLLTRTLTIPLFRYHTDQSRSNPHGFLHNSEEIWLGFGTTGFDRAPQARFSNSKYQILMKESYNLHEAKQLPLALIGRPGLGTIRDCISSKTIFLPLSGDSNPELNNNVQTLRKFGLIPDFWVENIDGPELEKTLKLEQLIQCSARIGAYWEQKSSSATSIAKQILKEIAL